MGIKLIKNTKIITPFVEITNGFIVVKDKQIHYIGDFKKDKKEFDYFTSNVKEIIDFKKKISVPGFIEIHTHGALGKDYSTSPELVLDDSKFRASKGVTGFLPTIGIAISAEKILDTASILVELIDRGVSGAKPLGLNLEGPFLRPDIGSQGPEFCFWDIDMNFIKKAIKIMGDKFKIITIAPELGNSFRAIAYLRESGVVPSIGHTIASEEVLDKAIRSGANLVTHLLNTTMQPQQTIRGVVISGVNEYLMIRDEVMAEVICDIKGIHVNSTMLKVLLRCKGIDKTIIVTDSFTTPGTEKGKKFYMPNGIEICVKDGVNIQTSGDRKGHITGSAMTMDLSVKSMLNHTGIPLKDGILMASYNPSRILGLENRKGSIEVGKDADITLIDENINIYATMVEGDIVYSSL